MPAMTRHGGNDLMTLEPAAIRGRLPSCFELKSTALEGRRNTLDMSPKSSLVLLGKSSRKVGSKTKERTAEETAHQAEAESSPPAVWERRPGMGVHLEAMAGVTSVAARRL